MTNFMSKRQKPHWISVIRFVGILVAVQLIFAFSAFSQNVSVSGNVTDSKIGEGIPGVTVSIPGTATGTVTALGSLVQSDNASITANAQVEVNYNRIRLDSASHNSLVVTPASNIMKNIIITITSVL